MGGENQLQVIVRESGLETTKAQFILDKFSDYFSIAAEWEKEAKAIVVTDAFQLDDIKRAREGRLFLKEKRVAIEKARKELKEQALREGKAIDGIANVLKALIVPIEEYLEKQERFVELRAAEEAARIRQEKWDREEAERREEERRQAEETERLRAENERLRRENEERMKAENERLHKEAEEREKALRVEREKADKIRREQEKKLAEERAKAEAERRAIEERLRREREEAERKAQEEREKQAKALAEEKRQAEELRVRLASEVECPNCHHRFIPEGK